MNIRRITALLLCVMVALLGGCTLIDIDEDLKQEHENAKVIIEYNGKSITKYDVTLRMNKLLSPQNQTVEDMMASEDYWPGFKESIINQLATFEIALEKAAALGLDQLTAEEEAQINEDYETQLASIESYLGYMVSIAVENDPTLDYDAEYAKQLNSYLGIIGYSADTFKEELRRVLIFEKVKAHLLSDVTVTEEDVQSYYDNFSDIQRQNVESNPAMFGMQQSLGTVLYYPEGYMAVKHILLNFDEDIANDVYSAYYYNETEEYDAAVAKGMEALQPTLDEIMTKLEAGEDFAALMEQYNEDPDMNTEPQKSKGAIVGPYTPVEIPGYTEAIEELKQPGDYTQPFATPIGAYIVRCEKLAGGFVPYEDVRDTIHDTLLYERTESKWAQLSKEWIDAAVADGTLKLYSNRY